jgi:Uma2 family endonuclease
MATAQLIGEQRMVLSGIDWTTYRRLLEALKHNRGVRLTYDRGELELMTLSHAHESFGHFLGRLIEAMTEELGLTVKGGGSTTFRRRRAQRGLEPDACYWVANEPRVRGKSVIDLRTDPPPDLAVEIEISRSALDRLGIYARLGVPEVWRYDGQTLSFHRLGAGARYVAAANSVAFPWLTPADLMPFLAMIIQSEENAIVRQFRAWVRQQPAAGGGTAATP